MSIRTRVGMCSVIGVGVWIYVAFFADRCAKYFRSPEEPHALSFEFGTKWMMVEGLVVAILAMLVAFAILTFASRRKAAKETGR